MDREKVLKNGLGDQLAFANHLTFILSDLQIILNKYKM